MFKLLIVDDEPIHRRGLTSMIARLRPKYEISDAKNGQEALEHMEANHVDILITDIQMPVMDGLELISRLRKITSNTKIIILSVYGYFDYAQQALKLGAFDYLLKPVDEDKVIQVLEGVEKKIFEEFEQQREASSLKAKLDYMLPEVIEHKMNKLVYGLLENNGMDEILQMFPGDNCGVVIVFELSKQQESSIWRNGVSLNKIKEMIDSVLYCYGHTVSFFLQDDTDSIISIVDISQSSDLGQYEVRGILNKIIDEIKKIYGITLTVGVGSNYEKLCSGINRSFKHARKALKCQYYTGSGSVIFHSQLAQCHAAISSDQKKVLVDALIKADCDMAIHIVDSFIQELLMKGYPDVAEFTGHIARFLENHIRSIDVKLNESYLKKLNIDIDSELSKCGDMENLRCTVKDIISTIAGMLQKQKNNISVSIIERCKNYIHTHYMDEISLESVAQEYHFSAAYFSNIFKCYTNSNFCEYLSRTRMDNAKKLLMESGHKVYEISKMVGYQDPKYFSRLFKKECGLTPEEYRRIKGMNKLDGKDNKKEYLQIGEIS